MKPLDRVLLLFAFCFAVAASAAPSVPPDHWGQWRGPLSNGVSPGGNPPIEWSEERNVRWKVPIPGRGHSSPLVWGDRVFVTTAIAHGEAAEVTHDHHDDGAHDNSAPRRSHRFVAMALDRGSGEILWQRTLRDELPHESTYVTATWANGSSVTDGERLYAWFGSRGLFALDMQGKLLWEADLGDMQVRHGHGEGSSPALHGNTLVLNWDHQGESFLVALDKRSGKQKWKVARDEITSWSSPLIVEHDGRAQVIVAATQRVRGYDLADGGLIWECGGLSRNVVATPVAGDGLVFVANSYDWRALLAIRLSAAKGDITGSDAVVWSRDRDTPYVPSPLLYGETLCFLKHLSGIVTCVDAATGAVASGPRRLPGSRDVYASPVGAAERIYIADRGGSTFVLRRGGGFDLLARNVLDDSFSASPAIVGEEIFLRGERHLYCIAEEPGETPEPAVP